MKEQVVKEWFERGEHDIEAAKILVDEEDYFDVTLFHIHHPGCPHDKVYW